MISLADASSWDLFTEKNYRFLFNIWCNRAGSTIGGYGNFLCEKMAMSIFLMYIYLQRQELSRRASLAGLMISNAFFKHVAPALAAYGESANIFGRAKKPSDTRKMITGSRLSMSQMMIFQLIIACLRFPAVVQVTFHTRATITPWLCRPNGTQASSRTFKAWTFVGR
jgi:hypothetical protein